MKTNTMLINISKSLLHILSVTAFVILSACSSGSDGPGTDPGDGPDPGPGTDDDRVAVKLSARILPIGTRSAHVDFGRTASGLEYREYIAEDGFETRDFHVGGASAKTRAANNEWVASDDIGVFMMESGLGMAAVTEDGWNRHYKISGAGASSSLVPSAADQTLYYPESGSVDFIAYYPFSSNVNKADNTIAIDITDQSNPSAIDLLYSSDLKEKASSTDVMEMKFEHKLSKMIVNVKKGEGFEDVDCSDITAQIKGMATTANFSLAYANLVDMGSAADFTALKSAPATGCVASFQAVVIPHSGAAGRRMNFVIPNEGDVALEIESSHDFDGGFIRTYDVEITKNGVDVISVTITPWEGINNVIEGGSEEIDPYVVPTVRIKAGKVFQMGSPDSDDLARDNEKPQMWVKITRDYYMSKYPITNSQFAYFLNDAKMGVMGLPNYASAINAAGKGLAYDCTAPTKNRDYGIRYDNTGKKWEACPGYEDTPAIYITWYGAVEYALWAGGLIPSEAQWEYACRAGTTTRFFFGDSADALSEYAFLAANNNGKPIPVGQRKPNPWGLYDLYGGVWEWCMDDPVSYIATSTKENPLVDPLLTSNVTDENRSFRGGFFATTTQFSRSAIRQGNWKDDASFYNGFRIIFPVE